MAYEFGLMLFFLDLGLSLDKIVANVDKLHKWRKAVKAEGLTLKDIIGECTPKTLPKASKEASKEPLAA